MFFHFLAQSATATNTSHEIPSNNLKKLKKDMRREFWCALKFTGWMGKWYAVVPGVKESWIRRWAADGFA